MGPSSYMSSVGDRNAVMRPIPVFKPHVAPAVVSTLHASPTVTHAVVPTLHASPTVTPAVVPTLHAKPVSNTSLQSQHNVASYNGKLLVPSLMLSDDWLVSSFSPLRLGSRFGIFGGQNGTVTGLQLLVSLHQCSVLSYRRYGSLAD
jgi:hypothetical protein